MALKNQNGFTLIELILFLALSGLFLLIALTGLRGRTSQIQLSDSMRSLESYLESELQSVRSGVNLSGQDGGDDEGSILLGRMYRPIHGQVEGETGVIESYQIYGDRADDLYETDDDIGELMYKSNPRVDDTFASERLYVMEWGLFLDESFSRGRVDIGKQIAYFGFLLNPVTNRTHFIIMEGDNQSADPVTYLSDKNNYELDPWGNPGTLYDQGLSLHLCYVDTNGVVAELVGNEERLDLVFDVRFNDNVFEGCTD